MHKDNPWLPADDKALLLAHMEDMPSACHAAVRLIFKRLFRFHDLPADPEH